MAGRKPDYKFRVLNKTTGAKAEVGAAWVNSDGRFSVTLNPCVVLTSDPNLTYCLFPNAWATDSGGMPNNKENEPEQPT